MIRTLKQLSGIGRLARRVCLALALSAPAAQAQSDSSHDTKLGVADLAVVLAAYVDSAVELHQFMQACAPADAKHWEEGTALILATMRRAGLPDDKVAKLEAQLASGGNGSAAYDCRGDVAGARLTFDLPADWVEFHKAALAHIGVEIVVSDDRPDARLAAVRAAMARHIPEQACMLNCMALVETKSFPTAYADWEGLVEGAAGAIAGAGYDASTVASIVDPGRSASLMKSVTDRQAAIADCIAETGWMTRYATFNGYLLKGDVEKAIGTKP